MFARLTGANFMNYRPAFRATLVALALSAAAQPSLAITWQHLGGYNTNGVPTNLFDLSSELPANLLQDIHRRLPEGKDIRTNDPRLITDDLGANLNLLEDAQISVAFVYEGAGYRNSVGFFTYDPANKPTTASALNPKIMFPNFSLPLLEFGDAVDLGQFKAGTAVGFTIVANGWTGSQVNPNQPASMIFHTLKTLNPEPAGAANLNAHTVLLSKPEDELLILGFEDLNRSGNSDDDFNDVLIAIKVTPFSAIDRSQVQSLSKVVKDTDGDGVADDLDAFPLDPERAARRFYPSATGYGYLAFEDNWPKKGDFDMNDLVVAYRTVEILNAQNQITDIELNYQIVARGAANDNAFAIHLPGVPTTAINPTLTTLKVGNQAPVALPTESGQSEAVFILASSVNTLTRTGLSWPCGFFNTVNTCPRSAPVPLTAKISFQQPLNPTALGAAPYDPFIYPNRYAGRGREVHLVDHPPTAKADPNLFGTSDDASNPVQGRYYRTADNLPWALDIPETWRHPAEWNNVANAYPSFGLWAAGSAAPAATSWYVSNMNDGLIFRP